MQEHRTPDVQYTTILRVVVKKTGEILAIMYPAFYPGRFDMQREYSAKVIQPKIDAIKAAHGLSDDEVAIVVSPLETQFHNFPPSGTHTYGQAGSTA